MGEPESAAGLLSDLVGLCRVARVQTTTAEQWSHAQRRQGLSDLDAAASAITAMRADLLNAEREAGTWAARGERDFASWVGRASRQSRYDGFAQVGQAATLAAMPAVADALVDGPVTPGHVRQLSRATSSSPLLAAQLTTAGGQAELVQLAGRLDAREFGRALTRLGAQLDPAARQRDHDAQRRARFLNLSHGPEGTRVKGLLDSIAGNRLQRAIDALCPRPALDDDRDRPQRRADALAAMADRVLDDAGTTPGSVAPPQVMLLIREESWAALRSPRSDDRGVPTGGSTADVVGRLRGVSPVTDEDGSVWPASEVAKALCDCEVTRLVLDAAGVPVDEGAAKRLFTVHQRKAIIGRDGGGCAFPGCAMPARYTQLHHITWWSRRRRTDLVDGVQLCEHDHGRVHNDDIAISRNGRREYVFAYPDGRLVPGSAAPDESPPGEVMAHSADGGASGSAASGASGPRPKFGQPSFDDSRERAPG